MTDPLSIRRLYGRAQGHPLRERQAGLIETLLPTLAIPEGPLSARRLFTDERPLHLEIGFGKGEHLAFQAVRNPGDGYIGAEPFLNGVAGLLADIDDAALTNIRLHRGDALDVLERLPDASLSTVWLLHPDPWPKARHAKRRFVNPGPMDLIAAKLKPGGHFKLATDHPRYLRHALMVMAARPDFEWTAETPFHWQNVPQDWPDTRFAAKARALGHEVWRLDYVRVPA
ncbi:tRNA (guanosine(46)-N7)-methyltransferase TrmB [Sandaracinobacteroides saxicola]|uniref:tRNA (guanine-N(7)-)-methyltransferase n=1 Tax=Sandaracinobacteroides saxicola TaxID=2759707 RepID=A0A7G5IGA5_9SPHN|nr:tRNA (guanosine(46)-N7)-methyltransferase TrmB [Sandaracinobacteroides saxicola]QMW22397.1 tRNA (guanosine(46)-N7)-methyltransferase TrmB [Sandaracinobacteroides saxicola]